MELLVFASTKRDGENVKNAVVQEFANMERDERGAESVEEAVSVTTIAREVSAKCANRPS